MKYLALCLFFPVAAWATELPIRPDPVLTPGATNPTTTKEMVCRKGGYTNGKDAQGNWVRNVPEDKYRAVFKRYNITWVKGEFEVDHLIPLSLGGTNDITNLWPQSYKTQPYNAHHKDKLEVKFRTMLCNGKISMSEAQDWMRRDWIGAYEKYVK